MRLWMRDLRTPMRRSVVRAASVLAIVAGTLALAGAGGVASADNGGPGTAIAYGSTYKALVNPGTVPSGFEQPGFDDSGWALDQAPFSSSVGSTAGCGFPAGASLFPVNGTVYLRKSFNLPANAFGLHIDGTIDNNADVYVQGHHEAYVSSGSCATGAINLDVSNSDLNHGGDNVVAVKAVDTGDITFFDMQATYGAIQFANQPVETQEGSPLAADLNGTTPIEVTITNAEGDPVSGATVDISLHGISGTGALSGTTSATTGEDGIASFNDLAVSAPGEYRLVATSEGATVTSGAFVIANQVVDCPAGETCTAGGSTSDTQVSATSSFTSDPALAVSVIDGGAAIPTDVCGDFQPLGSGSYINILGGVVGGGNVTATWTLAKSLVKQAGNPGAAHFDICLGAENLEGGTTPWTTKDGSPAVARTDPISGATLYWGLLPDCPKHGSATGPCILHRDKNHGNEVVSFYLPYPWDASFHGG